MRRPNATARANLPTSAVAAIGCRCEGDRSQCSTCKPAKKGEVRMDQVWQATLRFGGNSHRKP